MTVGIPPWGYFLDMIWEFDGTAFRYDCLIGDEPEVQPPVRALFLIKMCVEVTAERVEFTQWNWVEDPCYARGARGQISSFATQWTSTAVPVPTASTASVSDQ